MKLRLVTAFLFLGTSVAYAQTSGENKARISGWNLTLDNDTFTRFLLLGDLNEDRNYTQGIDLSVYSPRIAYRITTKLIENENLFKGGLYKKIENYGSELNTEEPSTIFLRFSAFTPDDLRQPDPIIGDRPYASVLWIGTNYIRLDQELYTKQSWELSVGFMGIPGLAEGIQTWIHEKQNENNTKTPYNPEGWDNQISNGWEPTLLFSYNKKALVTKNDLEYEASNNLSPNNKKLRRQLSHVLGFDVGHVTQIGYGIDFRFGKIDLRNWHQNPARNLDAIAVRGGPIAPKISYFNRKSIPEYYFYLDLKTSLMIYNGSLHGQFRSSKYTIDWNETGFIYTTSRIGLMIKGKKRLFSPYVGLKTPEFWNENSRIHAWAGFTYNRSFRNK